MNVFALVAAALLIGAIGPAHAELPALSAEEKAAAAAQPMKVAAAKAEEAKALERAQDKAVANYRKSLGSSTVPRSTAVHEPYPPVAGAPSRPGADHVVESPPTKTLTKKEAQTKMPTPGQANDHSSSGRETVPSRR